MKHEIFEQRINISDTDITFEHIYQKEYLPVEYLDDIKKANVLLIPNESFRDEGDILFPETTREFLEFLQEESGDEVTADIAVSDEKFQRIELHSAAIEIATMIVDSVLFNIAAGLITSFLYDLIKKYHRKPEDTSAKVKIISEETKTKKSKMIVYEGPVSGVKDALEQASKDMFSER